MMNYYLQMTVFSSCGVKRQRKKGNVYRAVTVVSQSPSRLRCLFFSRRRAFSKEQLLRCAKTDVGAAPKSRGQRRLHHQACRPPHVRPGGSRCYREPASGAAGAVLPVVYLRMLDGPPLHPLRHHDCQKSAAGPVGRSSTWHLPPLPLSSLSLSSKRCLHWRSTALDSRQTGEHDDERMWTERWFLSDGQVTVMLRCQTQLTTAAININVVNLS